VPTLRQQMRLRHANARQRFGWPRNRIKNYYDVQVLRPGTYSFRARLQRISNGKTSTWSPISSVAVD
jgi:hypothetical protein